MSAEAKVLHVVDAPSSSNPFTNDVRSQLASLLPAYLVERRWFRAKARPIREVLVHDLVQLAPATVLFVLHVSFQDGGVDTYLLPMSHGFADEALTMSPLAEALATLRFPDSSSHLLYNAFASSTFRSVLLTAINDCQRFQGEAGDLMARRLGNEQLDSMLESSVSRAEQSNTSVIYGQDYILKLFRKVEEGINPDLEIGAFLTEHGFANTPRVLGTLSYGEHSAGLLQRFVPNRGDAWKYTLETIKTSNFDPAAYREAARLLGQRTAEMHLVLSQGQDPAFAPEALGREQRAALLAELVTQADTTFDLARKANLHQLIAREAEIRVRIRSLAEANIQAQLIRFHGDYHLGQVLQTGSDFMIIDFEGEPARPLNERRAKGLALRDVAGMIRSFQYAAYSAELNVEEQRAADWFAATTSEFVQGYRYTAGQAVFMPQTEAESRIVLDAFLMHKALYEVAYELNNRPNWARIPLQGVFTLLKQKP